MGTFIFACGGTGGHIFPALSVGEELRRSDAAARIVYVCGKKDIESVIFNAASLPPCLADGQTAGRDGRGPGEGTVCIDIAPYRGAVSFVSPVFLLKLLRGFFQSMALVRRERPALVAGFGGYVSFPVILAAKCCGIPTMLHEQNVLPGRANRMLAPHVDAAALSFAETKKLWPVLKKTRVTGNPIRASIERECRQEALRYFGFSADKKTLLVLGGSQGAESVNTFFLDCLEKLSTHARSRLQVLHLCGRMRPEDSESRCGRAGIPAKVFSFFERMDLAYGAADLCVGRAGATFLAEVATKNIPVLLVPYPFADGHQYANADVYQHLIGARVAEQRDLNPEKLAKMLEQMMQEVRQHPADSAAVVSGSNARQALADFMEATAKK